MEISSDQRTGTCEYCGSTMTLPRIDDEQRAAAFNRGNHFRRIGEFDKALAVYEGIVREDENDAEAHWCCALCRFGIEYVKDPASGEYLPTCHRSSFDSFLEDVDYKAALEHADMVARAQYQKDGEKIAQVQRGILSISQREQPFDVFICYKESDERGNRTVDSTLAQEIYYQLTDQGRRVFFARITLEDKAAQNGVYTDDDTGACLWWLRSPRNDQDGAAYVNSGGSLGILSASCIDYYVRPALWINLESIIF